MAQPYTPSELAWGSRTNASSIVFLPPTNLDESFIIPENSGSYFSNIVAFDPQNFTFRYGKSQNPLLGIANVQAATGLYAYIPNLNATGGDSWNTFATAQGSLLSATNTIDVLIYSTNMNVTNCATFNNPFLFIFTWPNPGSNSIGVFSIYSTGPCPFTNIWQFGGAPVGTWNPQFPQDIVSTPANGVPGQLGEIVFNQFCPKESICTWIISTNPPTTTQPCESLTNANYTFNPGGDWQSITGAGTNGIFRFSGVAAQDQYNGRAIEVAFNVCGGPTNRTVLVTGLVTNTYTQFGDAGQIALNFVVKQNIPTVFSGTLVTPVSFNYLVNAGATNRIEYDFIINPSAGSLFNTFPQKLETFSGVITNVIQ